MSLINRSRILNKPPTLTQTHRPLQSSPKQQKQRKKLISNLRLYNTNSNNYNLNNNNNQSLRSTSINNRTPNSWTFAMISHNNNLNSFNQLTNNSTAARRTSRVGSSFAAKNSTISLPKNNGNNTNFSIPLRTNKPTRSTSKLLSSTRRPFLSRSINYNSFINPAKGNQTASTVSDQNEVLNRPTPNQRSTTTLVSSGRPKSTLIAISTTSSNQNPFNSFNPVHFMQNIFDQFFGSSTAKNGNTLFPWMN